MESSELIKSDQFELDRIHGGGRLYFIVRAFRSLHLLVARSMCALIFLKYCRDLFESAGPSALL